MNIVVFNSSGYQHAIPGEIRTWLKAGEKMGQVRDRGGGLRQHEEAAKDGRGLGSTSLPPACIPLMHPDFGRCSVQSLTHLNS